TELVIPANHRIRPVDLGAMAGCAHTDVLVRRQPRVVIIPTGDELVSAQREDGQAALAPGQIIEYNSLVLHAQVIEAGGTATIAALVPDDLDLLREALAAALQTKPDLVLVLSGSSAGSKDYTASVIRNLGELLVHGIAVRPGHPVIIGMADKTPVFGIPGYPVSAALTGELFVQPLLAQWLGIQPPARPRMQAIMTRKVVSPTGDDDYVRV